MSRNPEIDNAMRGQGLFVMDGGQSIKSSILWDEETDAWTYHSNAPYSVNTGLYRTIPTLYRGISIIENEVQNVPFGVYNKRGEQVDTTTDWKNVVGFLPNPHRVFGLTSQALDRCGEAYFLKEQNRAKIVKNLRWMANGRIEPIFNINTGELIRFDRHVGTETYQLAQEDMLYFWLMDSDVENAPPESWPLKAALQAAGVLHNLDSYINLYFERGAIRPIVVSAQGIPNQAELDRMETWINRLMRGIKRAFNWKVFNAEKIHFEQIGDGLDQLQNQTLTADQRQDVALALGIPQTILFANSANYATSQSDKRNFYSGTIIPRCEFIAEVLNDQILKAMGYEIWPEPESLDVFQEDESQRSAALGQLVGAGVPLLMSMDLLGYDLTDEQRAQLEQAEADKEQRAETMDQNFQNAAPEQPETKSPPVGHEFYGNQWTGGYGGGIEYVGSDIGARIVVAGKYDEVLGENIDFVFDDENITVQTTIRETKTEIYLNTIGTKYTSDLKETAKGTGKGTKIVNALKKYSDKTGKKFVVPDATDKALPYWESIPFLERDYGIYVNIDGISHHITNSFSYTPSKSKSIDPDISAELKHWRRLCNKALREGKPLPADFMPDHIPVERAAQIAGALKVATNGADIKTAFEQEPAIPLPEDWPDLAHELRRANDLLALVVK